MNLSVLIYLLIAVLVVESVFAAVGLKYLKKFMALKKMKKGGIVKAIFLLNNGVIKEVYTKLNSETIKFNNRDYIAEPRAKLVDAETGISTWVFHENDSLPLNTPDDSPYLDPNFLEEVLIRLASTYGTDFGKWFKLILIAITVVAGMILFFMASGGVS